MYLQVFISCFDPGFPSSFDDFSVRKTSTKTIHLNFNASITFKSVFKYTGIGKVIPITAENTFYNLPQTVTN